MSNAVRKKVLSTPDSLTRLTIFLAQNIGGDSQAAFENIENIQCQNGFICQPHNNPSPEPYVKNYFVSGSEALEPIWRCIKFQRRADKGYDAYAPIDSRVKLKITGLHLP